MSRIISSVYIDNCPYTNSRQRIDLDYYAITVALRKENHRRNNDISFDVLCVGKGDKKNEEGSCSIVQRAVGD